MSISSSNPICYRTYQIMSNKICYTTGIITSHNKILYGLFTPILNSRKIRYKVTSNILYQLSIDPGGFS